MKTKIVYIVVSKPSDFYLEQTLLSVCSLKYHNPNSIVELVIDDDTNNTLYGCRLEILKYIDNVVTVSVPEQFNMKQKSRFLKTNLRNYIEGDMLFVDSDTLVVSNIEEVDNWNMEIGATLDKHLPLVNHPNKKIVDKRLKVMGVHLNKKGNYMNSGVMYVKDTSVTRKFYEEWNMNWKWGLEKYIDSDQPSLALTDEKYNYIIKDIGGSWNCQLSENGLKYLNNAKILHYFASVASADKEIISPFNFYQPQIYRDIRKSGNIPDYIRDMIIHPQSEFVDKCQIIAGDDIRLVNSIFHKLAIQHPRSFSLFEMLVSSHIKILCFPERVYNKILKVMNK